MENSLKWKMLYNATRLISIITNLCVSIMLLYLIFLEIKSAINHPELIKEITNTKPFLVMLFLNIIFIGVLYFEFNLTQCLLSKKRLYKEIYKKHSIIKSIIKGMPIFAIFSLIRFDNGIIPHIIMNKYTFFITINFLSTFAFIKLSIIKLGIDNKLQPAFEND